MENNMKTRVFVIAAAVLLIAAGLTTGTAFVLHHPVNMDSPDAVIRTLPENLNSGLVLYFSFDNIRRQLDGTYILDDSGSGNNGVFNSGVFSEGKIGQAFVCKSENRRDSIIVKDNDSLDLAAVTVAAWIKTNRLDDQWGRILDKGWQTAYNLCIGGEFNGQRWQQDRTVFECAESSMTSKGTVVDGQWHFVAASYDGINQKLYIDGKLDGQMTLNKTTPIKHNNTDIHIGSLAVPEPFPYNEAFDGLIDEVRLYNRVLSDEEVRILAKYQPGN